MNNINIGLLDINGISIKVGNQVFVEFVNYMNTDDEYVDDYFNGHIIYNKFNCMFMIERDDMIGNESHSECDKQTYIINHRSMRIKVINEQNTDSENDDYLLVKESLLNCIETLLLVDIKMSPISKIRQNLESAIDKFKEYICTNMY